MGLRLIPPHETVPASVYKHLLPHEQSVITVRFHPAVLIRPVVEVLSGLALAGLLSAFLGSASFVGSDQPVVLLVIWLLWLILVGRLLVKIYCWLEDYFVITSQRLLLATGLWARTVNMMPLSKVTDMSFKRSTMGRLLGYGEFVVESAGQDQALRNVTHLPYPEQLYLEVCGLIFKDPGGDD